MAADPSAETKDGSPLGTGVPPVRVDYLRLVFSPAPAPATTILLNDVPVIIGRDPNGERTFRLEDAQSSRSHARIERSPETGGWRVVDLNSRNGVFVDGVPAASAGLHHGTVLRLGRSLLAFTELSVRTDARLEPETAALRGPSLAMQMVRGELGLVAAADLPVLILGETGVGKERAAQELHRLSRRSGPFIAVNCAAIPEALAESELFGHVAGAFTGATYKGEGLFVAADRGTLFLDEVGELPAAMQSKLLRVLATREVRPVGGTLSRSVDVRIVAAINRGLGAAGFRPDLHARLAAFTIRIPPLRERRDDILVIARAFLEARQSASALSVEAAEALLLHDWPHNVRQLENAVAGAALRGDKTGTINLVHLPEELVSSRQTGTPLEPPVELLVPRDVVPGEPEMRLVIDRMGGNVARIAAYFGKDRRQIYRWIERLGIDLEAVRANIDDSDP